MENLLKELFPELKSKEFNKGDYLVLRIKPFHEKTGFVLASKKKNLTPTKPRPVIITNISNEEIKFTAFTTNIFKRKYRPKINLDICKLNKNKDECFGINPDKKLQWIFAKKTPSKRWRVFYNVDIYTLSQLKEENNLKICGNCEEILNQIFEKVKELGEIV